MNPRAVLLPVLLPVLLLAAASPAMAGVSSAQLRDQVVSSLSASGTIDVAPDGKVQGYVIDQAQAYDPAVLDLLARDIPRWTFKPFAVEGAPHAARFRMYLRLQAKPLDDKRYEVGIASAAFGTQEKAAAGTAIRSREQKPVPRYPLDEMRQGIGANVVAVLLVDRTGKVKDVAIEQTNLKAVGRTNAMEKWREHFEHATRIALQDWTFVLPTVGPSAGEDHWGVRVPVVFIAPGASANPKPGQWESYVPGPRHQVSWRKELFADSGVDALPGGAIYPVDQPLHLLTALNPE